MSVTEGSSSYKMNDTQGFIAHMAKEGRERSRPREGHSHSPHSWEAAKTRRPGVQDTGPRSLSGGSGSSLKSPLQCGGGQNSERQFGVGRASWEGQGLIDDHSPRGTRKILKSLCSQSAAPS